MALGIELLPQCTSFHVQVDVDGKLAEHCAVVLCIIACHMANMQQ